MIPVQLLDYGRECTKQKKSHLRNSCPHTPLATIGETRFGNGKQRRYLRVIWFLNSMHRLPKAHEKRTEAGCAITSHYGKQRIQKRTAWLDN